METFDISFWTCREEPPPYLPHRLPTFSICYIEIMSWIESKLGSEIELLDGSKVSSSKVIEGKDYVALYFSAHWYVLHFEAVSTMNPKM